MLPKLDPSKPRSPLEKLIIQAQGAMEQRGYRYHSVYEATRIWRWLLRFAEERGAADFSVELANDFLSRDGSGGHFQPRGRIATEQRAVRILTEFFLHGSWTRHPHQMTKPPRIISSLQPDLDQFLAVRQHERQVSPHTLIYERRYLTQWLEFLAECGVENWQQLQARQFAAFFASMVHLRPQSLALLSGVIRVFMRHLLTKGVVDRDWTVAVPNFRKYRPFRLPAIWTEEQIGQLLAAVDRASAKGKQDYAILLLACRLGMRASDIRTLRLEDLNWDQSRIDFVQSKTGVRNTLPLTEEVGQALVDYLRNSRPVSTRREVFLTLQAPFEPFGFQTKFYQVVTRYRRRAKIPIRPDVARGMHSLRHTAASRMLVAGVGLETIASVLGHADLETTRIYTHLDLESLRRVALDPEEVKP